MEPDEAKELAQVFKALSDATRLRLVRLLVEQGPEGALCVGALAARLGVSPSAVSQHLAVLRAVGLVVDDRRGNTVHYRLQRAKLRQWRERVQENLGEDLVLLDIG